jgi:hypothetical protein
VVDLAHHPKKQSHPAFKGGFFIAKISLDKVHCDAIGLYEGWRGSFWQQIDASEAPIVQQGIIGNGELNRQTLSFALTARILLDKVQSRKR